MLTVYGYSAHELDEALRIAKIVNRLVFAMPDVNNDEWQSGWNDCLRAILDEAHA